MFMVKDELKNIKDLLKIRIKTYKAYYVRFWIIYAILHLTSVVGMVLSVLGNNHSVMHHVTSDPSTFFLIAIPIGFIINAFLYRKTNVKLSVFPQTNNSRLISALCMGYIFAIIVAAVLLIIYLVNYGIIMLMSAFTDSIRLGLNIDAGFVIIGFFAYLMYTILIISVIELIAAIMRKWTYYAAIAFVALFSLMILNLTKVDVYLSKILAFLIYESSVILFFLKAIGLWIVITALTILINKYTVYYKSRNRTLTKFVVVMCVIIVVFIIIVIPVIMMYSTSGDGVNVMVSEYVWDDDQYTDQGPTRNEVRIDISHLPGSSEIKVVWNNTHDVPIQAGSLTWRGLSAHVYIPEILDISAGDILVIAYSLPWYEINGIDIYKHADTEIDAYLDGDTLHINYNHNNVTVIIMPVWNLMRQFDAFKDKGIFTTAALGYSSSANWSVFVNVMIE